MNVECLHFQLEFNFKNGKNRVLTILKEKCFYTGNLNEVLSFTLF